SPRSGAGATAADGAAAAVGVSRAAARLPESAAVISAATSGATTTTAVTTVVTCHAPAMVSLVRSDSCTSAKPEAAPSAVPASKAPSQRHACDGERSVVIVVLLVIDGVGDPPELGDRVP